MPARKIVAVESQPLEEVNQRAAAASDTCCTDCKSYYLRFHQGFRRECRPDCPTRRARPLVPSTQQSFWDMHMGSAPSQRSPSASQGGGGPPPAHFPDSAPAHSQPVWDSQF